MRRNCGTALAYGALYLAMAGVTVTPLFAAGGVTDATVSVAMVLVIALIPVTAILIVMLDRVMFWQRSRGRKRDLPESAGATATPPPVTRERFDFTFAAWNGIDSGQAVERLSVRLTSLGMDHRFDGRITVDDGDVRWQLSSVPGALRLTGWVEAPLAETRAMIRAAVEEFLVDELGLRLERAAA